jgi:Protein of unknown function (DUF4230)
MDTFFTLLGFLLTLAIGLGAGWFLRKPKTAPPVSPTIHSSIEDLRAIGELSVFKAITKEIVTETGHTFGEFGRKYLRWAFSKKKLAMIFEFDMDFRYNLQSPQLQIETSITQPSGIRTAIITLPPCECAVNIRNLYFYDEQKSAALPWLLPSLIGEAFGTGFSESDKNMLITSAREHAQKEAQILIERIKPEVERSARTTLVALAHSFGVKEVSVKFGTPQIDAPLPQMSDNVIQMKQVA